MFAASATPPDSRRSDEPIRDIGEEEQRREWGRPAATLRAEGGCGRSLRRLSSTMFRHRLLLAPRLRLANPRRKHHRIYGRKHLVEPRDTNHGQARRRRCPASPERPSRVQLFPCRVRHTRSWDLCSGQGSDHRGSLRHLHVGLASH